MDNQEQECTSTRLLEKQHCPMIIRKSNILDFPIYVGIICDCNLNDLDSIMVNYLSQFKDNAVWSIQGIRQLTGGLSDCVKNYYEDIKPGSVEGIAVLFYVDKMIVSSLRGDFMNHDSCRREFYECLNLMTKL